jgi:histidyl-tRNA synthetase
MGGLIADIDYLDRGMKSKWKQAANLNARFVAIYGEQEQANGTINLKDQQTGEERTIAKDRLYQHIVTELTSQTHNCACGEGGCDDCEEEE